MGVRHTIRFSEPADTAGPKPQYPLPFGRSRLPFRLRRFSDNVIPVALAPRFRGMTSCYFIFGKTLGQQIETLAKFVAETRFEDIPVAVRQHAKIVLLDTLGVILAGSVRPEVAALRERLAPSGGSGATVYARGWPAQDPRLAALLNGIAGRAIELCEGLRLVTGQAAMQVLPGVLAVGEQAGSSGKEMLAALVLGYDLVGRIGARVQAAAAGASERTGVAAGRGGGRGAAQGPRRGRGQPGDAHRHDDAADPELHQRRRRRDQPQRRRRDERVRRGAGARAGAGGVHRPAGRGRGGARAAGRRRVQRRRACSTGSARIGTSPATIFASTPAATRSTRPWIASPPRSPS